MNGRAQQARALFRRGLEDIVVLRKLVDDADVSDAVWGFHAQQAVEKHMKAVLATADVVFPYTHQLYQLDDLLTENGCPLGTELAPLLELTPFGVDARYALETGGAALPATRHDLLRLIEQFALFVQQKVSE